MQSGNNFLRSSIASGENIDRSGLFNDHNTLSKFLCGLFHSINAINAIKNSVPQYPPGPMPGIKKEHRSDAPDKKNNGATHRIRTDDLRITNASLYQLS